MYNLINKFLKITRNIYLSIFNKNIKSSNNESKKFVSNYFPPFLVVL